MISIENERLCFVDDVNPLYSTVNYLKVNLEVSILIVKVPSALGKAPDPKSLPVERLSCIEVHLKANTLRYLVIDHS